MGPIQVQAREFDEALVVAQAQTGDGAAFGELVQRYEKNVLRIVQHITRNSEDAEDVLQDTFLNAYLHLPGFQGNAKFYTWLVRIAVNQSLMKLRRRKSEPAVSLDDPSDSAEQDPRWQVAAWDPGPEQAYSQEELRRLLERASNRLPAILRTVYLLRDIQELSEQETAAALGLTIPAVKSRLLRARLRLRNELSYRVNRRRRRHAL